MEICVDFDGTCVTHDYPEIGHDIGAANVLRKLVNKGHKLILFTMRSNSPYAGINNDNDNICHTGLDEAVGWFNDNNIPLYGIQTNPTQNSWTSSPKAYGQLYIDDAAIGCPLVYGEHSRPYVDWEKIEAMLIERNIL